MWQDWNAGFPGYPRKYCIAVPAAATKLPRMSNDSLQDIVGGGVEEHSGRWSTWRTVHLEGVG